MNPKEAKDALDYFKRRKEMYLDDLIQKRENAAIQALEKQVPKAHDIRWNVNGVCYDCPDCGIKINGYANYCYYCGQKIDWSE